MRAVRSHPASEPSPLRLTVLSDLHVDHRENMAKLPALAKAILQHPADALVLAGDLSHKMDHVEKVLEAFAPFQGPKLFVAGNHDIWIVRQGPKESPDSWAKLALLSRTARAHGFHPLEESNLKVGDHTFVGTIGWYDHSFANLHLGFTAAEYEKKQWRDLTYMDRDYARWGQPDNDVVKRLVASVEGRLQLAKAPVVFVSHHVPLAKWVLRRGHAAWDYFNAFMGSRRLERLLKAHHVTRFVFGHTHRPVTLIEPGEFVINNPVGYPRQALTPVETPFLVS